MNSRNEQRKPHFEFSFAVILQIIHNALPHATKSCYLKHKLLKLFIKKSSLLRKEVPGEKRLMSDFRRDM